MLPRCIQRTIYHGVEKQIETVKENIKLMDDPDFPDVVKPTPSEITDIIINIEKSMNYLEDFGDIAINELRNSVEEMKKISSAKLIPVLA